MIRFAVITALFGLSACANQGNAQRTYSPPGTGQYQYPAYLRPVPAPRRPDIDECRSRLYYALRGQHEGGIVFSSLPGRVRVIKSASTETPRNEFLPDTLPQPPFREVREFLAGQVIYAPSIEHTPQFDELANQVPDRLTIEIDQYGYVAEVRCG